MTFDLCSKKGIQNLLNEFGVKPSKGLGQNFLINRAVLQKIIDAADLKPTDIVLEIGPGIGNLTQELAKKVKTVVAVEKDRKMAEILRETLKDYKNVEIIEADVLKFSNFKFQISNYKVVANLPYYITSPAIRKFLESEIQPDLMVLTIQKEVAQRICAKPPKMNLLAVSVQFYAVPKIISYVKKESFWPKPKVDSAIIKLEIRNPKSETNKKLKIQNSKFFRVVKAGFSQPRKQVANNLSNGLALSSPNGLKLEKGKVSKILLQNGISPQKRAESLTIEDWINLSNSF